MKHLKHPATIIAAVALFLALGGGAVAYASGLINGSQIKNHSIATKKLTKTAIKQLHGARGKRGPAGPAGAAGAPGPQGPGGAIATYDATASASPTIKTVGTFLGVTYGASCGTTAGDAELNLYLQTTDGSWSVDTSDVFVDNGGPGVSAFTFSEPAGFYSTSQLLTTEEADSGGSVSDDQIEMLQFKPSAGSLIWHLQASTATSSPSCHFSVEGIPESLTAVTGTPHTSSRSTFPHH